MTEKAIIHGSDIRSSILSGIDKIFIPVSQTLGSHGKFVAIEKPDGTHRFTKDGVSVASEIFVEDKAENLFIRAIVDASFNTLRVIGDGTTSTIILSHAMVKSMLDAIDKVVDRKKFFEGVDNAMSTIEAIHKEMKTVSEVGLNELIKVATTSSNGDYSFGKILGEIYHKIGSEGIVNIKYHNENQVSTEFAQGYIMDEGLIAKDFINNNGVCRLENPHVIITNREIDDADDFLTNILGKIHRIKDGRPLLIIASNFSRGVLQTIIKNSDKIYCCPVKAPSVGDMKNSYLEDIAHITGATFIDGERDMYVADYDDITSITGSCKSVEVGMDETIIRTDREPSEDYINDLKGISANTDSEYAKEFTNNRIAKLNCSIATLLLKRATNTEMSLDYDRYDDAIKATRNALKNGVVAGGGVTYIQMWRKANMEIAKDTHNPDFIIGFNSIIDSLLSVTEISLRNSNHNDDEISRIITRLKESEDAFLIYDTVIQEFVDSKESGVLESYLSSISCIRNAFGVSKTIVNTGSAIIRIPSIL